MIKATFYKNDGKYDGYSLSGHALFADFGKDIVCAAVSALYASTTNGLNNYTALTDVQSISRNDIRIQLYSDVTEALIQSFYDALLDIEHQYPKNVSVEVKGNE